MLPHPGGGGDAGRGARTRGRATGPSLGSSDDRPSLRHRNEAVGGDARGDGGRRASATSRSSEDPTVNELQRRAAELLGHERALFLPTATMANQIALRVLTRPGGQLIAEERTHILIFEAGGPAVHSGLIARPLTGARRPDHARADP